MGKEPRVRVVALAVVRRAADGAVLLGIGTDPAKGEQFCRPVGGGIEFGERSGEACRREMLEEVGADLRDLRPLGVLENLYSYKGEPGHEIAFLHEARLADPTLERRGEFPVEKKSRPRIARWFRPGDLGPGRVPLVPEGLLALLGPARRAGRPLRVLAADWSGAESETEQRSKIWLAEAAGGQLVDLRGGWTRASLAAHLLREAKRDPTLVVGLDFAFSFPRWFLDREGVRSAPALWERAGRDGERWLHDMRPPFWGWGGSHDPNGEKGFRATEIALRRAGFRPKSAFQVRGGGTVGTGSIRGMPVLAALRSKGGFVVPPFDPPGFPAAMEIYPRLLTGRVARGRRHHDGAGRERADCLDREFPGQPPRLRTEAVDSDDAFDAAVSALVMDAHRAELISMPAATGPREALEGRIWAPWEVLNS